MNLHSRPHTLESVNADVLIAILAACDSFSDLASCIRASPTLLHAFLSAKATVLLHVVSNILGPATRDAALLARTSGFNGEDHEREREVDAAVQDYKARLRVTGVPWVTTLDADAAVALVRVTRLTQFYVNLFSYFRFHYFAQRRDATQVEPPTTTTPRPPLNLRPQQCLSRTERGRIAQAVLRCQLLKHIHEGKYWDPRDHPRFTRDVLSLFHPWELEQVSDMDEFLGHLVGSLADYEVKKRAYSSEHTPERWNYWWTHCIPSLEEFAMKIKRTLDLDSSLLARLCQEGHVFISRMSSRSGFFNIFKGSHGFRGPSFSFSSQQLFGDIAATDFGQETSTSSKPWAWDDALRGHETFRWGRDLAHHHTCGMADISAKIQDAAAQNSDLLRTLAETDHAPPDLEQHNRFLEELQAQLRASDARVKSLGAKRALELKEHKKYRDSSVRRFMYKAAGRRDRFAEKADKGERDYFEVLQRAHDEDKINAGLRAQAEQAQQAARELEAVAARNRDAQARLDALYHAIFAGPTPQFPDEDAAEQRCDVLLAAYRGAREACEAEAAAARLLANGDALMRQGLQQIATALSYSRVDMFGGGGFADMMERNALADADRSVMMARLQVSRAQKASPHVKELPGVNINHGHIFADVFFDNIFTDMAFHEEIKRGQAEMLRCANALRLELGAAQTRRDRFQGELARHEADLKECRIVLQEERRRVFDAVAALPPPPDEGPPISYEEAVRQGPSTTTTAAAAAAASTATAAGPSTTAAAEEPAADGAQGNQGSRAVAKDDQGKKPLAEEPAREWWE
ncbi:alpha-L-fucosidase [Purpureocillium lavendulum]|uniref:Alpha-L-fucosidase n=1 Tax=Purpureocillium lavendulum TaxID=1247861 RepID=A0AB34FH53_9HYPO|nr:alpha-L-fucosidase [Purpureocillium lavendulum]